MTRTRNLKTTDTVNIAEVKYEVEMVGNGFNLYTQNTVFSERRQVHAFTRDPVEAKNWVKYGHGSEDDCDFDKQAEKERISNFMRGLGIKNIPEDFRLDGVEIPNGFRFTFLSASYDFYTDVEIIKNDLTEAQDALIIHFGAERL